MNKNVNTCVGRDYSRVTEGVMDLIHIMQNV